MEKTFHGLNRSQLNQVLNILCDIEDTYEFKDDEQKAFNVAIQCTTQILNRMGDGKQINWD